MFYLKNIFDPVLAWQQIFVNDLWTVFVNSFKFSAPAMTLGSKDKQKQGGAA